MEIPSELILVTGANGFVAAHVVDRLVKKGYRVRGTVRGTKLAANQEIYRKVYGSKVEIVAIDDIVDGDFTTALQGVDAVIHIASPLAGSGDATSTINSAVLGSTKILRRAIEIGIKRFSVTSSIATALESGIMTESRINEKSYSNITQEQALACSEPKLAYYASKVLAERAIDEIGAAHPDVSIAGVNPTAIIGPYAPATIIAPGDVNAVGTNLFIYNALFPSNDPVFDSVGSLGYVDVRDVALAMIAGINTPGKTRNVMTGEWFDLKDAVELIGAHHPELKVPILAPSGHTKSIVDDEPTWKRLGLTPTPWKDSVLEAAEAVLKVEKDWIAQGIDVDCEGGLRKNKWRVE